LRQEVVILCFRNSTLWWPLLVVRVGGGSMNINSILTVMFLAGWVMFVIPENCHRTCGFPTHKAADFVVITNLSGISELSLAAGLPINYFYNEKCKVTVMLLIVKVSWDVMPCWLVDICQRFERSYFLHLLELLGSEGEGTLILRNVDSSLLMNTA
jgi:hypothetical protein